ncbi:BTB/POZ domain-containing protein POB1-like [Salvia hispanica]|uniref:BTB/POZ domain-containing protein POB1-like n=1 Tax=Salvia hispanica TaxID=49212 RepID=UPI002009A29A|nr:BTB/POZ domain-containing protein POB1-like [Salvia hispanica]
MAAAAGSPESPPTDYGFAFDDANFSDRVMRIEIIPDLPRSKPDPDDNDGDWTRSRKRRRDDPLSNSNDLAEQSEVQVLNSNIPDLEDGVTYENQEEAVAMIEELPVNEEMTVNQPSGTDSCCLAGPEVTKDSEPSSSTEYLPVQVRTVHISSPILAARSPFFYKLFSNGMRESEQRHVTLRIQVSEEAALMDLLSFMYSNTLQRTTPTALLDVLMAADKYEVASCMRYCSRLLRSLPMTCQSALRYLDLPSTVLMADTVQQLTDAAKQFLAARFKDLIKYQEEVISLPLAGFEAVLSSDDLQVPSEDAIFEIVLKWARVHYSNLEERREVLSNRLIRLIRFSCMTSRKLKKVLICGDIDPILASKVVLEALFFKAETPHRQRSLVAEDANASYHRLVERSYKYRPVKVVEFESPRKQCIVYLDLKRNECAQLFPSGRIHSQAFHLGGQGFFLSGHCNMDQNSSFHCFGLFLGMQEKGSVSITVEYEFAARMKPSKDFESKYKGKYVFLGGKAVGYRNLFTTPWTAFMADDSPYFINGILHLRAELTINK